mmetsp:Transcript_9199/g.17226  ORF Transcript_9199/g.17226 Transcript_9199/m.17226 type:complete len:88 (+) Transcript_9199:783-1046(+)
MWEGSQSVRRKEILLLAWSNLLKANNGRESETKFSLSQVKTEDVIDQLKRFYFNAPQCNVDSHCSGLLDCWRSTTLRSRGASFTNYA